MNAARSNAATRSIPTVRSTAVRDALSRVHVQLAAPGWRDAFDTEANACRYLAKRVDPTAPDALGLSWNDLRRTADMLGSVGARVRVTPFAPEFADGAPDYMRAALMGVRDHTVSVLATAVDVLTAAAEAMACCG